MRIRQGLHLAGYVLDERRGSGTELSDRIPLILLSWVHN